MKQWGLHKEVKKILWHQRENIPWALRTTKSTLLSTELKPQERSGVSQQEESQRTAGAWDFSRIHQPRGWREWQE